MHVHTSAPARQQSVSEAATVATGALQGEEESHVGSDQIDWRQQWCVPPSPCARLHRCMQCTAGSSGTISLASEGRLHLCRFTQIPLYAWFYVNIC